MKILITGSKGFIGRNLVETLKSIKYENNIKYSSLFIEEIYEYDIDSTLNDLYDYTSKCDFVFHLAGVNRSDKQEDYMNGNFDFTSILLSYLKKHNNKASIMFASSIQASCIGRYNNEYGKSKKAGENLLFEYARENNSKALVYRFPNLFGKWCRPNYNSVVATFCYNIANNLPIKVNNRTTKLELVYIDDLIDEMILALLGQEHHCDSYDSKTITDDSGNYCIVPISYHVSLGEIADLLYSFDKYFDTLILQEIPINSFAKKLYSTYLSYLPKNKISFPLKMNIDNRGSFTELIKTSNNGQFSVNISKAGVIKGNHWHNTKCEIFIVVSGHALIQLRKIGTNDIISFEVSSKKIEAVYMLPGYTHNIINLSKHDDLVTLIWANEQFDSNNPDTFYEVVENETI